MLVPLPSIRRTVQLNGWLPDPKDGKLEVDVRDAPLGVEDQSATTADIDNRPFYRDVSDQCAFPSCTANACADLWEAVEIHKLVRQRGVPLELAKSSVPDKSRMFAWWNGRNEMDPCRATDPTSGCFNRLIMDVVGRHGLPREATWPYDDAPCGADGRHRTVVKPSIQAYREAFASRSTGSYKLFDTGTKRVDRVIQTLQVLPGVAFGTAVNKAIGSIGGNVAQRPDSIDGRHAMVLVGWSAKLGAFLVRNSWSKLFGMSGYFWMSADYVAWSETDGLWVVTG